MADAQSIFRACYENYSSTLKQTSFDSNNELYLCKDESVEVYDFDAIVKNLYPSNRPSSYDALIIDNKRIFCIEFKNEKYSDVNNQKVEKKLKNGKDTLTDIFNKYNIPLKEYTFMYCVAYRSTATRWRRGISKNIIQFGLEQFKPKYFNEIYTNDIQFFTNEYKKYFQEPLTC